VVCAKSANNRHYLLGFRTMEGLSEGLKVTHSEEEIRSLELTLVGVIIIMLITKRSITRQTTGSLEAMKEHQVEIGVER